MKQTLKYNNISIILFAVIVMIWGTSWYVITLQIHEVPPTLSTAYRFILSGILLSVFCLITGRKLVYKMKDNMLLFVQGLCLFGLNYCLVYSAEIFISSGVMAALFSTLIIFNIILNRLIRKQSPDIKTLLAAVIGISGTTIIFIQELMSLNFSSDSLSGLIFGISALLLVSFGNIISVRIQERKVEIIPGTAIAMLYGGVFTFLLSLFAEDKIITSVSNDYLISLFYLSIFASIIAFIAYLKLIQLIDVDRAAYAFVLIPVVSIIISTIFEGFTFTIETMIGLALIVIGNIATLRTHGKHKKRNTATVA